MAIVDIILQEIISAHLNNKNFYYTIFGSNVFIYERDHNDTVDHLIGTFELTDEIFKLCHEYISNTNNKDLKNELTKKIEVLVKHGITNTVLNND